MSVAAQNARVVQKGEEVGSCGCEERVVGLLQVREWRVEENQSSTKLPNWRKSEKVAEFHLGPGMQK